MVKYTWTFVVVALTISMKVVAAVDESSDAYQTGALVGKIFMAVLLFMVIKKIFFKKKG